jgi:Tfp pilus assembly protein PilP
MRKAALFVLLTALLMLPASTAFSAADPGYVQKVSEAYQKTRDPFRKPSAPGNPDLNRSDLESYPAEGFKMVGVVTGFNKLRAMVSAPNGKTYFVSEKMKIGVRKGYIRKITADQILVREKIVNVLGEEENVDVLIPMESKPLTPGENR